MFPSAMMKKSQLSTYGLTFGTSGSFCTLLGDNFRHLHDLPTVAFAMSIDTQQLANVLLKLRLPILLGRSRPLGMCPVVQEMTT
jgi:hypothetical protein